VGHSICHYVCIYKRLPIDRRRDLRGRNGAWVGTCYPNCGEVRSEWARRQSPASPWLVLNDWPQSGHGAVGGTGFSVGFWRSFSSIGGAPMDSFESTLFPGFPLGGLVGSILKCLADNKAAVGTVVLIRRGVWRQRALETALASTDRREVALMFSEGALP
jgi:hypothetical protein